MVNGKKVIGIICEFNPFHKGHKFLIDSIKEKYPASYIVCVMSGDFVQRGECAIVDKYIRTKMALNNNIDLVIEMPVEFSTSSAKDFASCGVSILNSLSYVDNIAFATEHPNDIVSVKQNLCRENEIQSLDIQKYLKSGYTYAKAISTVFKLNIESNDILAIEYLKALDNFNSKIKPIIIQKNKQLPSALKIRNKTKEIIDNFYNNKKYQSKKNNELMEVFRNYPIAFIDDFSEYLNYKLIDDLHSHINFSYYYDIKEDLSNAIKNTIYENLTFSERVNRLKTKNYTYAHISRCLLHIMLGIADEHVKNLKKVGYFEYIRVLGVKKESQILLKYINPPFITGTSNKKTELLPYRESLELNTFSSNIYNMVVGNNQNELCRKFIVNML